jgi:surface antigen
MMKRISLILALLLGCGAGSAWAADSFIAAGSLQSTLEFNRTNQASTWVDPDTGQSGSTVPTRTFQNAVGQPCREFTQTIIVAGRKEQGYGTACRQPDGSWQIVNDQPVARAQVQVEQPRVVYVREAPVRYVYYDPYPYAYRPYYPYSYCPFYYPIDLALSFGFIYSGTHGGGHYGSHVHGGRYYGGHRGGGYGRRR